MAFQSRAADSGGSYEPQLLEPFIHQVGGHSSMLQLDEDTICKPYISQELNFYKTAPDALKEFMAEFKGIIEVTYSESDDGYIDLTTYLPSTYRNSSSKSSSRQNSLAENEKKTKHRDLQKYPPLKMNCYLPRIRLCQSGKIKIDRIKLDDVKKNYEEWNCGDTPNGSLNPWVEHCHQKHVKNLQISTSTILQKYILLENLVSKFEFPCILDVKMGTRQYGDNMSQAKKQSHTAKAAASTSAILGVRLSGMQLYSEESGSYTCHNKYFGRGLTAEGFQQVFFDFLHDGIKLRRNVVAALLSKLRKLHSVVRSLNTFRFFTSSLLIIYDGSSSPKKMITKGCDSYGRRSQLSDVSAKKPTPKSCSDGSKKAPTNTPDAAKKTTSANDKRSPIVDVCMIDFAHSTHDDMPDSTVSHEGPDKGYLFGLENLITHLEVIQQADK